MFYLLLYLGQRDPVPEASVQCGECAEGDGKARETEHPQDDRLVPVTTDRSPD